MTWMWVVLIFGLALVVFAFGLLVSTYREGAHKRRIAHEQELAEMEVQAWEKTLALPPRSIMQAPQVQPYPKLVAASRLRNGGAPKVKLKDWRTGDPVMYESTETRTETRTEPDELRREVEYLRAWQHDALVILGEARSVLGGENVYQPGPIISAIEDLESRPAYEPEPERKDG
jgi:hypothetical protein